MHLLKVNLIKIRDKYLKKLTNKLKMSKKILLIYAGKKANVPRFPISCMALAAYLREHKYSPEILDLRINPNFENIDFNQYLCVGISTETGEALKYAIKISKHIKKINPELPIIWGGHHASFHPEETLDNPYIDCIVKNEGEQALLNSIKDIEKDSLKGCLKKIYEEKFIDIEKLPLAAYELVDIQKYSDAIEGFGYESSRGCPHRCKFCYANLFHRSKWRSKSVKKTTKEIENLVNIYKTKKIRFLEDNFFVNKKRALEIAESFIKRKLNIEWTATIRFDYLSTYKQEELKLLKESGYWVAILGAESGSQKTLDFITKDITTKQIEVGVKKCLDASLMTQISFMAGFPTETKEEVLETLNFYDKIVNFDKKHVEVNGIFIFCPYPGTDLYQIAINHGYKPPKTLEEWGEWQFNNLRNVNWLKKKYRKYLQNISLISRFKYFTHRINFSEKEYIDKKFKLNPLTKIAFKAFIKFYVTSAEFRWKRRLFNYAPEWWVYEKIRNLKMEIY